MANKTQIAPLNGVTPLGFRADVKGMLDRRANAPLKSKQDQKPCDVGLFSDDAVQMDLPLRPI
jgi:hypothetical protein